MLIVLFGIHLGVQVALGITLLLAVVVLFTQRRGYQEKSAHADTYHDASAMQVFRQMPGPLKRLLLADCLVRIGEGIALIFIVLYVTDVLGVSAPEYGVLYAIQQSVAIILYLPSGKLADLTGRKPLVALTFVFFALFPLAVQLSHSFTALVAAFVVGGLKEMGEPARKSLIVDLSDPAHRGRSVGVYYTIRNLLVVPAGTLGGLLWQQASYLPFQVSFVVGMIGVGTYLIAFKGEDAHRAT
jgi:MFS family permease